jgi:hypothetical protein
MKDIQLPIDIGHSEGWGVFNAEGKLELQRLDEAKVFVDDEQAWGHVAAKAHCGSSPHKKVLQLIRENNREEWERIMLYFKSITKDC